jgi:hypothetical protein
MPTALIKAEDKAEDKAEAKAEAKAEDKETPKNVFLTYFQNDSENSVPFCYKKGHHIPDHYTLNRIIWNARKALTF